MIEDTPYLIVDNLRISPIRRINRIQPVSNERTVTSKDTMGIVDRVTLSKEGRQLAAQMSENGTILPDSYTLVPVNRQPIQSPSSLLTYSRNFSK
jgi:hypothetical protein